MCQNNDLIIKCPLNELINIKYAMYGRVSQSKCKFENFKKDKCVSNINESINKLKQMCDSKQECNLVVNEKILGNPCKGVYKYLDVKYECVSAV